MKNVLLVAGLDQRYYYDPFIKECVAKGVRILVFDPSRLPQNTTMSVSLDEEGNVSGTLDVFVYRGAELVPESISISDIDVAWHLREATIPARQNEIDLEARFADNESQAAVHSILSVLNCRWVNRRDRIQFLSSNKFYQQLVAQRCGLAIPRTLISNAPDAVVAFSDPAEGLLLKSIGYIWLDAQREYFLYSERFSHQELKLSRTAIEACPIFAQEYIDKRFEYRVMAIGDRVLSCRIDSQASSKTKIDWRHYDFDHVEHVQVELPADVQRRILRLMQRLDLRYGALDMIETPNKDFVFLEVNPSGQWGWLADLAGLPIPAAVAEMLAAL